MNSETWTSLDWVYMVKEVCYLTIAQIGCNTESILLWIEYYRSRPVYKWITRYQSTSQRQSRVIVGSSTKKFVTHQEMISSVSERDIEIPKGDTQRTISNGLMSMEIVITKCSRIPCSLSLQKWRRVRTTTQKKTRFWVSFDCQRTRWVIYPILW